MNELRRMAYLDALGIDSYVSRAQLPGAAVTQRLVIVAQPARTAPEKGGVDLADTVSLDTPRATPASPAAKEGFTRPDFGLGVAGPSAAAEPVREQSPANEPPPRFTLSAIIAGEWLWLEELDGMPLTTNQVQLVQSMTLALGRENAGNNGGAAAAAQVGRPEVAQFDWPMHNNRQLDQGEEAARASVAAFINRKLEQRGCRGLILLGQACAQRVPLPQLQVATVCTLSSAEILANPMLKRQVWQDLQPLRQKP